MISDFQSLFEVVVKQRDLYASLLQIMEKMHEALQLYRSEEVDEYNKIIETMKLKADVLEKARQNIFRGLIASIPNGQNLTLAELAESAPLRMRAALLKLRAELRVLVAKIAAQNEKNMLIAHSSLSIVSGLGRLLRQVATEPLTYSPPDRTRRYGITAQRSY